MHHERKYRLIAQRLLRDFPEFEEIKGTGVRIAYLASPEIKKKDKRVVYADCNLVSERYKWTCPYDFFIVVYENNILDFTEEQIEILIRHELHHVGVDYEGGQMKFVLAPHDVEEFWDIINEHGLKWSE